MPGVLVMLSGGMDSTIALYDAIRKVQSRNLNYEAPVHAITFNYGQRHRGEIEASRKILAVAKKDYPHLMGEHVIPGIYGIPRFGSLMFQAPVRHYEDAEVLAGPDPSFIPYRNLLFITQAAMWAHKLGALQIVTGLRGGFPDCSTEYEVTVQLLLRMSVPDYLLQLDSPVHIPRAASIRLAQGLPGCMGALGLSMTCFEGKDPPCGECLPCRKRAEGFKEVGIADPLLERQSARAGG